MVSAARPPELEDALRGRRVVRLDRRGKYLVWELSDDLYLAQHLRMTGAVLVEPDPEPAHTRVRMVLGPRRGSAGRGSAADGAGGRRRSPGRGRLRVVVTDPRRFGTGELLAGHEQLERFFAERLGLEPFDPDFTAAHLRGLARGRKGPIKALLLDQRRIAGVGNITPTRLSIGPGSTR